MAFKVKRFIPASSNAESSPIKIVDPGKVLKTIGATIFPVANTVVDAVKGVSKTVKAYKARNYKAPVDSEPKIKVKSQVTKDGESGYEADDRARKNKTGIYAPKQKKTVKRRKKASTIEAPKAKKIERTIEAPKASDVSVSKKPTVKTAPKDNSRKAIRKRKKADKAAGVSKSQMRANKAKSKSEKALAKSKATKDSVNKAHLKSKSERLAKRAERKGGSPVKEVKQAKKPSKKNIDPKPTPKQKIDKDPVKHFNSFTSKATQRTAKNPYPKDSVRNRKFSQLQNNLRNSSR